MEMLEIAQYSQFHILSTHLNKLKYFIITNIKYHFIKLNLNGIHTERSRKKNGV